MPYDEPVAGAPAPAALTPADAAPLGTSSTVEPIDPTSADEPAARRLYLALDAGQLSGAAQGALAELAGCTPHHAGRVLQRFGNQLSLRAPAAMAGFFLTCLASTDPDTQTLIAQILAAAGPGAASGENAPPGRSRPVVPPPPPGTPGEVRLLPAGLGIAVRGDLDLASAPLLAHTFTVHQQSAASGEVVLLDLHDMTFCDVAGVRALAALHAQVTGRPGGRLHVDRPTRLGPHRMLHLAASWGWLPAEFVRCTPAPTPVLAERPSAKAPHNPAAGPAAGETPPGRSRTPALGYLDSGVFSRGALIMLAMPPEQDTEIATTITTWLTRISHTRRAKVVVLDLRWAATPTAARWWLRQVLRVRLPHDSSVIAINVSHPVRTREGVTVVPIGTDPTDTIRAAYRVLRAKSVPSAS